MLSTPSATRELDLPDRVKVEIVRSRRSCLALRLRQVLNRRLLMSMMAKMHDVIQGIVPHLLQKISPERDQYKAQ